MTEDKYTRLPIDYVIKSVAIITREDLRKSNSDVFSQGEAAIIWLYSSIHTQILNCYGTDRALHYIVWTIHGGTSAYINGRIEEPWRKLRQSWQETTL